MDTNYHAHQTPQFRVLSDGQIEKVYQATLECLNRTGVNVLNAEARDLLAAAGARVDGARVRIPPHIIQDGVAANPRSFTLWGRDGKHRMQIVPDRVYFGPGPTCTYFVDPETGERHKSRRGDPGLTARVCDALDNVDYVMGLALIDDVHHRLAPVYEFAEMITNTGKPVLPWAYSVDNISDIYRIALVVAGSEQAFRERPFFALFATFQAPLQHTDEELANALWAVERDIPIVYLGGGTAGSTAPVTGAGTLVISLAGALSGLAIMQLKKRGTPVCIGGVPQAMDLRTGRPTYGGPEMSLYSAALSEVARYLGLPFMGTAGASEAKVLGLQAAIESTVQVVLSGLSGATLVHDVGFLDCADIGSLEMLVMTDEIIAMTRRIMRGVEVSDDTLMLDLIDRIGPAGEFMSAKETAKRCRAEAWTPTLMDRDAWVSWEAAGSPVMHDRIKARVKEILAAHEPPPLPDGAGEKIEAILRAAEAREAGNLPAESTAH
ncbi:MAG: trimethylamine methyltransferase family protein [Chloroflexota bacterium]|nr:trimethylamine methyltransferase family protein [Chloroflexota bacterium]